MKVSCGKYEHTKFYISNQHYSDIIISPASQIKKYCVIYFFILFLESLEKYMLLIRIVLRLSAFLKISTVCYVKYGKKTWNFKYSKFQCM